MHYDPAYYYTPTWLAIRKHKLNEVGHKCESCGFRYELNVHHRYYKTFGNEDLEDLVVLCKRCHNDLHFEQKNNLFNYEGYKDGKKKTD